MQIQTDHFPLCSSLIQLILILKLTNDNISTSYFHRSCCCVSLFLCWQVFSAAASWLSFTVNAGVVQLSGWFSEPHTHRPKWIGVVLPASELNAERRGVGLAPLYLGRVLKKGFQERGQHVKALKWERAWWIQKDRRQGIDVSSGERGNRSQRRLGRVT